MGALLVGIDEAGYGPMLGPMCSGMAAVRVPGDRAVDVWGLLGDVVCRDLRSWRAMGKRPIAVGDSKKLKLANDSKTRHPLFHLERGVLAFLHAGGVEPATDGEAFAWLGVSPAVAPGAGGGCELPMACERGELGIASNALMGAMERSGVGLVGLRCGALEPRAYNELVRATGTKASSAAHGIAEHLRWLRSSVEVGDDVVRVVCDRLSGRTQYAGVLRRVFEDGEVAVVRETGDESVYRVRGEGLGPDFLVMFRSEAEGAHLAVGLASMTAKWVRELAMGRFNGYWGGRCAAAGIEVKPTAGYVTDARRWLADCEGVVTDAERVGMVRVV